MDADSGAPLDYDGPRGVLKVLAALADGGGWWPIREAPGSPIIGLASDHGSVTLEPGAQLELSGEPVADIHAAQAEMLAHLRALAGISRELNLAWLATGFHPTAALDDLPAVPKRRYAIMREYLPGRGGGALDMMWRTASVQSNFDYESEEDALRKLSVSLRLAPIVATMTANSPFREGRHASTKSARAQAWLQMDPERSGLIRPLWELERATYRDYVEWALDAGMFLFVRGDEIVANTGQTFRSFLQHGYLGHRATAADWKLHLNTLFPEVRLRHTVEVRCSDALPAELACAVPALFAGILYDERALDQAERLALRLDFAQVHAARPLLVQGGLDTVIGTSPVRALAEDLLDIAAAGLQRRSRCNAAGEDERIFLEPLMRLVESGRSPADLLVAGVAEGHALEPRELIERTRW